MKDPDLTLTDLCKELTRIREAVEPHSLERWPALSPRELKVVVNDLFRLQIRCADARVIR